MGQKELLRGKLVEMVKQGKMRLKEAVLDIESKLSAGEAGIAAYLQGVTGCLFMGIRESPRTGRRTKTGGRRRLGHIENGIAALDRPLRRNRNEALLLWKAAALAYCIFFLFLLYLYIIS
jgi:hypothetical protein